MSRFQQRPSTVVNNVNSSRNNSSRSLPEKVESEPSRLEKSSDSSSKDGHRLEASFELGQATMVESTSPMSGSLTEEPSIPIQAAASTHSTVTQAPPSKPTGSPSPAALSALRTGDSGVTKTTSWGGVKPGVSPQGGAAVNPNAPRRGAMFDPARRGSALGAQSDNSAFKAATALVQAPQPSSEVQSSLPPPKPAEPKPSAATQTVVSMQPGAAVVSTQSIVADIINDMTVTSVDSEDTSTFGEPVVQGFINPFTRSSLKLPNEEAFL